MTAVDTWRASQQERHELMVAQVHANSDSDVADELHDRISAAAGRRLDTTGRGTIPTCPICASTMRIDLGTNALSCDRHGPLIARWLPYDLEAA